MKPRIFYLTEFQSGYQDRHWFDKSDFEAAIKFVKHIQESYGVKGKVIKVKECPKTTKKKNQ